MVAKSPPKQKRVCPALLNPNLLRETVKKVDQCMARLQELQYTVSGGAKVVSGATLSPRSTRGYLKTSIRCKQESLWLKNSAARKSPVGKFQGSMGAEWRRMSLPAMLVGETVGEILQASQFAKEVVAAVAAKTKRTALDEPKTPINERKSKKASLENTEMRSRRKKEKQVMLNSMRSESDPPSIQRARARINFKVSPNKRAIGKVSPSKVEIGKENWHVANRVSPRNKPWAKKTVLFPNPLFNNVSSSSSSHSSHQKKFSKTRSPVLSRTRQTPHKFVIKSPTSNSKFQVRIKSPPVSLSPTRPVVLNKKSPKVSTAAKLRRSFSPSRLANRLVSPLKSRISSQKSSVLMSGLKKRQSSTPMRFFDRIL
ncbi:hypothetical protein Sjap_006603 [Stephania japonica]|uniref:Microtubule-binding protein TANGLED n=1 Tax=Stephania japonica TaxID=461633 RepID=A0AAP0K8Q5_9MAGN